jgi:holin, SPP1 family
MNESNNSNNKLQITSGTIARTAILILALVNQVLTATGHSVINISDENINTLISTGFTIVSAIIAWWKNNSFTQAALEGDKLMHTLKDEEFLDR